MTHMDDDDSHSTDRRRLLIGAGALGVGAGAAATPGAAQEGQDMTEEERQAVAVSYLRSLDSGGVSPETGIALLDHFAEDAEVYFPKWGVARGSDEIAQMFADIGATLVSITHHYDGFNWYMTGTPRFALEGTSEGEHRGGPWEADNPPWGAGRFCDCFEVRDGKITRLFIYLDPDYAGNDTGRYPWISA